MCRPQSKRRTQLSQEGTTGYLTLIVKGSQTLFRPDGRAAILLDTLSGPIAFEIDQQAIDTLRQQLLAAETFLKQRVGNA